LEIKEINYLISAAVLIKHFTFCMWRIALIILAVWSFLGTNECSCSSRISKAILCVKSHQAAVQLYFSATASKTERTSLLWKREIGIVRV